MAYIMQLFKRAKSDKKLSEQELMYKQNDKIFIFIVVLATIVIAVDYALIMKFMDIIGNL